MKKTLGGDRLGSGKKMEVDLHNYSRSTHDLGYIWRSSMAAGTLVPFMSEIGLPGDTFDIDLDCDVKTHPTLGPLFGSYKIQLDVFQAPIRLYNAMLHNNMLGIGMNMNKVLLPQLKLDATKVLSGEGDVNHIHVNPSCLLHYLGIAGVGIPNEDQEPQYRQFNALPLLAYWDIYKNYYANKQEEIGVVISATGDYNKTITSIEFNGVEVTKTPTPGSASLNAGQSIIVKYTGDAAKPELDNILIIPAGAGGPIALSTMSNVWPQTGPGEVTGLYNGYPYDPFDAGMWEYNEEPETGKPMLRKFPLENIDQIRTNILQHTQATVFEIDNKTIAPYGLIADWDNENRPYAARTQEGLGIKTYQSDLFNNWLQTEWIDGVNGISAVTAVDTSDGNFTIDTLNLSKKVYDMLNRIAVSGGTYDDWLDAVYTHERYTRASTPMYMGGLSKELVFEEVVSNSAGPEEPLGTLAGRGRLAKKHKGGKVTIKIDEPSYLIGLISLTPRVDYSQGNKWDVHLKTMDDLHKPALDEIGFQELITEQMAWWSTKWDGSKWAQKSAGKQPAWINYMTNVNRTHGNFAIEENEMFMTLNRRYETGEDYAEILDLTTYIDPSKFNFIFAETSLDSQNFWTQIAVDITARRKMSAKVMPNL